MILKGIGYWRGGQGDDVLPDPRLLVGANYNKMEQNMIVKYLRSGVVVNSELGYSWCRFRGGPPEREMGSSDISDGKYVWPEGLWHYVDKYHVKLPSTFIAFIALNNYTIKWTGASDAELFYDFDEWIEWGKNQTKHHSILSLLLAKMR